MHGVNPKSRLITRKERARATAAWLAVAHDPVEVPVMACPCCGRLRCVWGDLPLWPSQSASARDAVIRFFKGGKAWGKTA